MYNLGNGTTTNGSSGYPTPLGNYYWGNKEQYLILASELHALGVSGGPITMLNWDVDNLNACPALDNFEIQIGTTTDNALSTWVSGLTPVYSPGTYQPVVGLNNFLFSTPFVWDGVSNVVVQVCSNNSAWISSGNASVKNHTTSFNSTLNYHADQAGVCASTSVSFGYPSTTRPNIGLMIGQDGCGSPRLAVDVTVLPQSANDVGVISIDDPSTAIYLGSETVVVSVENFGSVDQSNVPVSYKVDSNTVVTETITSVIPANDTIQYTFTTPVNMGQVGATYSMKAYTGLSNDAAAANDTAYSNVTHLVPNYCNSAASYTSYEDIAAVTFGNVSNTSPSPYTALYTDYTALTPGMVSPGNTYPITIDIQFSGSASGTNYCEVYIDYNRDGTFTEPDEVAYGFSYNTAGPNTGQVTIPNNALVGNTMMRIVARHSGNATSTTPCGPYSYGETEDYMLMIAPKIAQDAGVNKILNPGLVAANAQEALSVQVNNYGSDSITSVDVVYELNGGTPVTTTYNTQIDVDTFAVIALGNINLNYGNNSLCVYTVLNGDANTFNDQTCINVFREATVVAPYTDDFESQNLWFNDTLMTQWEMGAPTGSTISAAHSGSNAWVTKLDTHYVGAVGPLGDYLYTPKIDVSGLDSVYLKFWHQMNLDGTDDMGMLQASINGGPYAGVGYIGDANGTNWFNTNEGGTHGWRYTNQAWQQSEYVIDLVDQFSQFYGANMIQFRFAFISNGSSANDGWAIDDFEIELPQAQINAGVISIDTPATSTPIGSTVTVKVTVENFGIDPLSTIDVNYQVGNDPVVSEVFTPATPLASGATAQYTFTATYVAPAADYQLCAWTSVTGDAYTNDDQDCSQLTATAGQYDAGATIVWPTATDTTSLSYDPHVYIEITNYGTETLTSIPVMYDAAGTVVNETWTGTLAPGATVQYMFTTTYGSPLGNYSLCVETQLPNDVNSANDDDCQALYGEPVGIDNIDPNAFVLNQNQPNPATQLTIITYELPVSGDVRFELRNSLGQLIMVTEDKAHSGQNTLEIDAANLTSGVYYYSIEFNGVRKTLQMVVTK
jgi:hypothetical protein